MFRTSLVIKTPCKAGQEVSENKIKWSWWLAEAYNLSFCWFSLVKSKRKLPALSLWHTVLLILNNCFVNNTDNRVLQINTANVISFFKSKVWNFGILYPPLETTSQKATPFALYCDCLYVCSLRTWVLTGLSASRLCPRTALIWTVKGFALLLFLACLTNQKSGVT